MKRLLIGGLAALALALTASSAKADCSFEYSCSRHLSYVHTSKNRCFSYNSCSNPLPCCGGGCPSGPALWNGLAAYGAPGYGVAAYAAPVAAYAAPVAAPAATTPSFQAPAPKPATSSTSALQQAGYFYYGPSNNSGYGYNAGYNYGAGYYGYANSNFQAPSYWYGN